MQQCEYLKGFCVMTGNLFQAECTPGHGISILLVKCTRMRNDHILRRSLKGTISKLNLLSMTINRLFSRDFKIEYLSNNLELFFFILNSNKDTHLYINRFKFRR